MNTEDITSLEERVLYALEKVRPYLNRDGGDIELVGVDGKTAYVKLTGNCTSCPMSFSTMKLGVEGSIRQFAPEIEEVVGVEE